MKKLSFLLFFLICLSTIAQNKKEEKEVFIVKDKLPPKALLLFDLFKDESFKKVTYILETENDKKSYEIKFKKTRRHYSAEFDKDGNLEDVEIIIEKKAVKSKTFQKIETFLKENFDKYQIEKIQAQYKSKGQPKVAFANAVNYTKAPDNYEMIVHTKTDGSYAKYELLFSASGKFKEKQEVAKNSYDYLIF